MFSWHLMFYEFSDGGKTFHFQPLPQAPPPNSMPSFFSATTAKDSFQTATATASSTTARNHKPLSKWAVGDDC